MNILFICGREPSYPRNAILLHILKKNYTVIECTSTIGSTDALSYLLRNVVVIIKFFLYIHKADAIFVGFFGQHIVLFINWFTRKPILFDAFISLYDTLCFDRKQVKSNSVLGKVFFWVDKKSCQIAKKVFLDTKTHRDYFIKTFQLPEQKVEYIYNGADESLFYPQGNPSGIQPFNVFYYGTGLPLQGIDIIFKAAKLLESNADIHITIVGNVQEKYGELIKSLNLQRTTIIDWVPYQELPAEIAKAHVCLGGHFSEIAKAKRVIAGKTFQFVAMKKPVILGDNQANKEIFTDKVDAFMCTMGDEHALADSILSVMRNYREATKVAEKGYQRFQELLSSSSIEKKVTSIINNTLNF